MYKTEDFKIKLSMYCTSDDGKPRWEFTQEYKLLFTWDDVLHRLLKLYCPGTGLIRVECTRERIDGRKKPVKILHDYLICDGVIRSSYLHIGTFPGQ